MPANKMLGVPKGFAFAPTGGKLEHVAPIPPTPAEGAALQQDDNVDPPPAKKTCTMLDMTKPEYACFEAISTADVNFTNSEMCNMLSRRHALQADPEEER